MSYPVTLQLRGRRCVVLGDGPLAAEKARGLLGAGARLTVISPTPCAELELLRSEPELTLHRRGYAPGDLAGQFLVVAATNVPAVNRAVFAEAESSGVLINAVDDPPFCDFYFPSVVRRGDLQIAISTGGESPALAQRLRQEINAALPLDTGDWLAELGNLRREVLQAEPLNEARNQLLHQLASRDVCSYDACPSRQLARAHARTNPRPAADNPESSS